MGSWDTRHNGARSVPPKPVLGSTHASTQLYVCVAMTLFMVLASYIGDVVVEIFTTYFEPLQTHQNNILYFDNFMHVKEVQKELRIKVNSYFELAWEL